MFGRSVIVVVGTAVVAMAVPFAASAQSRFSVTIGSGYAYPNVGYDGYSQDDRHDRRHDRLGDQHDDVHDDLSDVHDDAHEQGVSRFGHRVLHRDLQFQHADADYRIERRHRRADQRDVWQRQYRSYQYGYNRGYGYGYGY